MMYFNACPRSGCGGTLQECEDKDGKYLRCMSCGYHNDLNASPPLPLRVRKGQYWQGPFLPETPSNFLPWREQERLAWERDCDSGE